MPNNSNYHVFKVSREGDISADTNTTYNLDERIKEINYTSNVRREKAGEEFAEVARDLILNIKYLKLDEKQENCFRNEIEYLFERAINEDSKNKYLHQKALQDFQFYYSCIQIAKKNEKVLNPVYPDYVVINISEQGSFSVDAQIPDHLGKKLKYIVHIRKQLLASANSDELIANANAVAGTEYAKLAHVLINNIKNLKLEQTRIQELHSWVNICLRFAMYYDKKNADVHQQYLSEYLSSYDNYLQAPKVSMDELIKAGLKECQSAEDFRKFALTLSYINLKLALWAVESGLDLHMNDAKLLKMKKDYQVRACCGLVYNVAKQKQFWQVRNSPTEITKIRGILEKNVTSVEKWKGDDWLSKWEQIVKLAKPNSSGILAFIGQKDRHPDTNEFLKLIQQADPHLLEGFLLSITEMNQQKQIISKMK